MLRPAAFAFALALYPPAAPLAADVAHAVRPGDNPARLARIYRVPLSVILERNKGLDPCRIKIGDVVFVPVPDEGRAGVPSASAAPASDGVPDEEVAGVRYVVVPGDAPAAIAERFGVPLDALSRLNPGLDPQKLAVGRVLTIPEGSACAPRPVPVSRPGDGSPAAPLVMDFQ